MKAERKDLQYPEDVSSSKRAKTLLISIAFTLALAAPVGGATTALEDHGFWISEGQDSAGAPMTNVKALVDAKDWSKGEIVCNSISDPRCAGKVIGNASMYLTPCSESSTIGCITQVYAIGADGRRINGTFVRSVAKVDNLTFEQNTTIQLAAGEGMGGLWRIPGLVHGGQNDLYAVQARIGGNGSGSSTSPIRYNNAQFGISAVEQSSTTSQDPRIEVSSEGIYQGGFSFDQNCVMQEKGACFKRATFPKGYRFGIEVRVPNSLLGWFHGRFAKPEFSVSSDSTSSVRYRVEAEPVVVPELIAKVPYSSWTTEFRDYAREQWPFSGGGVGGVAYMMPGVMGKLAMELARRYLPMVNDKATASASFWVVKSLNEWADGKTTEKIDPRVLSCTNSTGGISGLVTTNAMVYSQGPPDFNEANQSLDYKVLSPHLDEAGREILGSYDLLIDSTVARCIYGFSDAPIKAELEIVGGDGIAKVATTVLGERGRWLFLSANGFTYSNPTIRVKLSQEKVVASTPSPSPTPSAVKEPTKDSQQKSVSTGQKTTSIQCKKGNKVRTVTGKNGARLTCPKGWKLL